jgi:protein SCO1/2
MSNALAIGSTPNFLQKLVMSKSFWLIFCSFFFVYPVYRSINRVLPPDLPVIFTLPEFKLIDENGKFFGSENLKGIPYLVNFHFTSCPTVCPEIMRETRIIQKRVRGLGTNVAIISITVDPEHDTPKKLFQKAREYSANPAVWKFLTGTREQLEALIGGGFKVAMGDKENLSDNLYDIAHSSKIFLVDEENQVRALYSFEKNDINKLMIDLGLLVNKLHHKGS